MSVFLASPHTAEEEKRVREGEVRKEVREEVRKMVKKEVRVEGRVEVREKVRKEVREEVREKVRKVVKKEVREEVTLLTRRILATGAQFKQTANSAKKTVTYIGFGWCVAGSDGILWDSPIQHRCCTDQQIVLHRVGEPPAVNRGHTPDNPTALSSD